MERIYSRKRLKVKKLNRYTKLKLSIFLILLGLLLFFIQFIILAYPIFEANCRSEAETLGADITSKRVTEIMKNYDYEDLVYIARDSARRNNNDKSKNCTY